MGLSKNQLFNTVRQVFNYINSVISPINTSLDEEAYLDYIAFKNS